MYLTQLESLLYVSVCLCLRIAEDQRELVVER